MRGLPGQLAGKWCDAQPCFACRCLEPTAVRLVSDMRNQRCHDVGAVTQVPLQDAVKPGMVETLERAADPAGPCAQARNGRRRNVARLDQRPAGQVAEQPHVGGAVDQTRYGRALLACGIQYWHGDAQGWLHLGDQFRRQVLRFQFGRGEGRIGDLEHPRDIAGGADDHEVLVLVTAQRLRLGAHAVVDTQNLLGLHLAYLRRRELRCLKEIETNAHRLTNWTTASENASLSSPAAVWPASDSSTNSACGTLARESLTPSGLTTSDSLPRISRIGMVRSIAACSSFSSRTNASSAGAVRNFGSQCQYHRPSRWRRFFFRPSGLRGLVRWGRYAATASAASSSDSKPCTWLNMKSRIRALPSFSYRGTTSTSTSLVTFPGPAASATRMPVMPPMLAPIKMTGRPILSRTCSVSAQSASTV